MAKKRHRYVEPENENTNNAQDDDNLILGQEGQQDEQMKFRDNDNSRPDPSVEDDLANRDTPFDKVDFPDAPEGYGNYEQLLASEEYKKALDILESLTGQRNIGTGFSGEFAALSNAGLKLFQGVLQNELQHEEELENLCVTLIRDHFKIPEEAVDFNFKLIRETLKMNNTPSKQQLKQKEEELTDQINDLNKERAKRRLINAMTQGHSVDQSYIFTKVQDELVNILGDPNIVVKYSIIMILNFLNYWQMPQSMLDMGMGAGGGEGQAGAGKAKIDTTTNPPTLNAEGLIFPVLVHEGLKVVMEYLGKEREPEDEERSQKAMELEDQIQHEIWDIRLGPAIWRKLSSLFPNAVVEDEDKKKLQFYMYSNIANLPVNEFLVVMKEILQGSEDGKGLLSAMYYDLTMVIDDEEVTEQDSHFRNKLNEIMENSDIDNVDLDDLLGSLGISLSDN